MADKGEVLKNKIAKTAGVPAQNVISVLEATLAVLKEEQGA